MFYLYRKEDESKVSGTGFVAEGILFASGKVAISWLSEVTSCTVYDDMVAVNRIHGHGGKTIIAWEDHDFIDTKGRLIVTDFTSYYVAETSEYLGVPKREDGELKISVFLEKKHDEKEAERWKNLQETMKRTIWNRTCKFS